MQKERQRKDGCSVRVVPHINYDKVKDTMIGTVWHATIIKVGGPWQISQTLLTLKLLCIPPQPGFTGCEISLSLTRQKIGCFLFVHRQGTINNRVNTPTPPVVGAMILFGLTTSVGVPVGFRASGLQDYRYNTCLCPNFGA